MKLEPIPRPKYLDMASAKSALISYHTEKAGNCRAILTDLMMAAIDMAHKSGCETREEARECGFVTSPEEWWAQTESLGWDDSPTAVFRDMMRFHERCVEELVNG